MDTEHAFYEQRDGSIDSEAGKAPDNRSHETIKAEEKARMWPFVDLRGSMSRNLRIKRIECAYRLI